MCGNEPVLQTHAPYLHYEYKCHQDTRKHQGTRTKRHQCHACFPSDSAENQPWNNFPAFLRSFSVGFDSKESKTQDDVDQEHLRKHKIAKRGCSFLHVELGRGATLGISGWRYAAKTLELLAYTKASFSWISLPYTPQITDFRLNSEF